MKKPIVLIAAIVAVVGLCAAVAVAKETTEVPTSVTLHVTGGFGVENPDPGDRHRLFSGKVTAFLAPLAVASVTTATGSPRAGMAAIGIFLVLGMVLMMPVRAR